MKNEKKRIKECLVKKLTMLVLTLAVVISSSSGMVWGMETEEGDDAKDTISQVFDAVNLHDWDAFTNLMCQSEKSFFEYYFSDSGLTDGVKQVTGVELVNTYKVDNSLAQSEWLVDEYPVLETSANISSVIAEVKCRVNKENQFFFNGINYFLIVLVKEGDSYKVVQFNRPSVDLVDKVVQPLLEENTDIYQDEQSGIEVLESAECGLVVNADDKILTDGFTTVTGERGEDIMPLVADPPVINHYTSYSYPTSIKVKLDKTGSGKIATVGFTDYMKHVLPNEWIPGWKTEALKAGAYCVKMVGIYRAVKPMSSAGGYNLTQTTQNYQPDKQTYSATSSAIESIKNKGMANHGGCLFFPNYKEGSEGSLGTKASGELKQWGSQALASQGYTYKQILNYYYSGSDYSSGDLNFFSYNLGY